MVTPAARRNLEAHIRGESARNLDALMTPLSDRPRYVIPGFVLEGRAAVQAMYQACLPMLTPELSDEFLRALGDPAVTRWGENHCVIEYSDAYPLHRGMVVVVHFDGDRVMSENTYFTSASRFAAASFPANAFAGIAGATPVD